MTHFPMMTAGDRRPVRGSGKGLTLLLAVLTALALLCGCACAEEPSSWICPACGQVGNTGNFCPECGSPRPASETSEASDGSGDSDEIIDGLTQIPGETDRVMADILRIDGSGYVRDKKDPYRFEPGSAADHRDDTCWQVSAKNLKKNQPWLAMIMDGQTVDEIWIKNGNRAVSSKGKSQYSLYARMKEIRVVIAMNESDSDELVFTLSDESGDSWEKLDIGRHENVYDVIVYIQSVYPGSSKKNNVCLSEFMLVQRAPSSVASPPWWE